MVELQVKTLLLLFCVSGTHTVIFSRLPRAAVVAISCLSFYFARYNTCLLNAVVYIMALWPRLLPERLLVKTPKVLIGESGPLGPGSYKAIELLFILLSTPSSMEMGPAPSFFMLTCSIAVSGVTFLALHLWSTLARSRGAHAGMAKFGDKYQAKLGLKGHLLCLFLGFLNALCEEGLSRGLFAYELRQAGMSDMEADLTQSFFFGLAHIHGTPSGVAGVFLTFLFGLIMSALKYQGGGLFLPLLVHGLADYYIFVFVSRRSFGKNGGHRKAT